MKNISTAFKKALYENERNYLAFADVTLSDGTVLHLTNSEIWTGGYTREDAISEDENFTVLGSAIAGSATLIINNIEDQFSEYSFTNAKVRLYEGMEFIENGSTRLEKLKSGRYTVDDTQYNGAKITLSLLDNMIQFDRPYTASSLRYPATCDTIVRDLCTVCGVTLRTFDSTYKNTVIQTRPSDEAITCREVLSWVATICGTFAKCNVDGELELKWFDITKLQSLFDGLDGGIFDNGTPNYTSGDIADGGTFNPWNTGYVYDAGEFSSRDDIAIISSLKSQNIAVDNTVIAGIRIYVKNPNEDAETDILTYTYPVNYSEGVLVEISDNEFITPSNADTILQRLRPLLYGLTFRKANVSQLNDPSLEAGDVGYIIDRKNNYYPIIITRNTFKLDGFQTIVCGSQSVLKNSSVQFSSATKSFLEYKRLLNKERTAREVALGQLSDALAEHSGLYSTTQTTQSGNIYYLHDMPDLADSKVVWKMTTEAFGVTTNYNGEHPEQTVWNGGMTVNGDVIANILDAIGVNASWINTGQLVISNNGQEIFFADVDAGVLRISAINTAKQEAISAAAADATTKATTAYNNAKSYTDTQLGNYENEVTAIVGNLQDQIDGQIQSWYYNYEPTLNNYPASDWTGQTAEETEEIRQAHEGDIFYWKSMGYAYRFLKDNNVWTWKRIRDTDITTAIGKAEDAIALADQKKRTFITQPIPPYDEGDLWTGGSTGDIKRCKNGVHRVAGASYVADDWELASKYTDDSALQSWVNNTYASDKSDLQTQIDGKIQTWRQDEDPVVTEGWSDSATKAKHVGDIWYCTSADIIPSWLSSYVNTETGMTALVSSRVDDGWYEISNAVNFTIDGATSTNIYIDTNSVFAFADTQPSTSGRNQAYNLNICRRDGQAMSIKYQVIESGSNKAVKVRYNGYTEYQQSYQTEEYSNEYEVFFTNANEIYINTIKQPTHTYTSGLIDTSIKDSGTTVSFSLIADTHASIKKVNGAWVASIDEYSGKSWMYDLVNGAYSWQVMDSGVPEELLDEIDGKSSIYTTTSAPTDAQEGDLWFKGVSDPIKTYHNGQWVEYNKYTDDTAANAYTDSKISTYDTNLNQQAVFNKLTNNGSAQGIFIENGNLYINMSYLKTGELVVGGSNNASGIILMKNSSGNTYGRWDNAGIKLGGSGNTQTSPNTTISTSGVIEVSFGSSKYARMSPTNGFEVQGNKIKAKLYASEWTYQSTDSFNPDSENPDLGPNDPDLRPGFLGLNTAIKITDTNNYLGTYTAVGKNYVEIGYSAQDYVAPDLITMRSTSNGSYLRIVKKGNDLDYMKEMVLGESGFKRFYNATVFNNHWRYTPVTSTLTIGNTTYYCIGGILCRATD